VDRIVCGNGSDELIGLLTRAYVGPDDELLISENHFVMCPIYGMVQDAKIVIAPEKNFRIDVDAILDRVTRKTRMVSIANPNNPTGTYLSQKEVARLNDGLPPDVLLLLDCAYAEYVVQPDFDPGATLVRESTNVIMTRTFSKIYGLAGLRIGWAYGPKAIIDIVQRIRCPFNTNCAALAAAEAAVKDTAFIERVREHNAGWLARISDELAGLGLAVVPSVANFYLIDFSGCSEGSARGAIAHLESRGIIPRPPSTGAQEHVLRITVGLDHENEAVLSALREYLTGTAREQNETPKISLA
jgi:histidinol-phosphate aminotransferase